MTDFEIETTVEIVPPQEWVSIRIGTPELRQDVAEFLRILETRPTSETCKCLWAIHEADVNKPPSEQRKRKIDVHPECPAHTREGLIIEFVENYIGKSDELICSTCEGGGCPDCTDANN